MEIAEKAKERSTVILAVLSLMVIGLTVLLSTWQTFRRQREAEEQHLFLTSRAVLLAIESSVRRGAVREGENRLSPRTADFFQALERDGDVLFVGIVDERGGKLLTSPLHGDRPVVLPDDMVNRLIATGEWHGRCSLGHRAAYLYGKRLEPLRGMHMSLRDDFGPPGFLVVGIDMDKYLGAYAVFRRNVLLQTLYILAAAFFTGMLGLRFLGRYKQARKAAALELFQAKLLDNLPDGLISLGPDGMVHAANPAALRILNRAAKDVVGRPASELPAALGDRPPQDAAGTGETAGMDGAPDVYASEPVWRIFTYEGAYLEALFVPLASDPTNALLIIIRDRTRLLNLEKSLAKAEKLAAVGALATGIAHEVRNPLSSLRGFAQYFVKKLAGRFPESEYAKTMVREADRLNRVITDLLFLGRPKPVTPRLIRLDALLREIISLLRFDLESRGISVALQLDTLTLFVDEDALKQVLLNLMLNSLDALPAGNGRPSGQALSSGNVDTFQTGGCAGDFVNDNQEPLLRVISGSEAECDWIEVRDKGCGMNEEQRKLAFEAFYTTKERGTGLGLALVQRTMLDHDGSVHIESAPGKGCGIRLTFPKTPANPAETPPVAAATGKIPQPDQENDSTAFYT